MLKILLTPHPLETLPAHMGDAPALTMEYTAIHPDLTKTNVESFLFSQMATGIGNFYNRNAVICAADALPGSNNTKFYGAALVQGFAQPIAWYAEIVPDMPKCISCGKETEKQMPPVYCADCWPFANEGRPKTAPTLPPDTRQPEPCPNCDGRGFDPVGGPSTGCVFCGGAGFVLAGFTHKCRECNQRYTQAQAVAMETSFDNRYQPCGHHQTALKPIE